jgi:hypothetical protein
MSGCPRRKKKRKPSTLSTLKTQKKKERKKSFLLKNSNHRARRAVYNSHGLWLILLSHNPRVADRPFLSVWLLMAYYFPPTVVKAYTYSHSFYVTWSWILYVILSK